MHVRDGQFCGSDPWEFHPDDEYIQVIEGKVEVVLCGSENKTSVFLAQGDIFIIPKKVWHRQFSQNGVKLLFVTSSEGNQHSSEDPSKSS